MAEQNVDMGKLLEQAKKMQAQMQKAQKDIIALTVTGEAGGGQARVTMNGAHYVSHVEISPALMGEDEEMLEDLMAAAFNDAAKKIEALTKQKMVEIAKDMNLPAGEGEEGNY